MKAGPAQSKLRVHISCLLRVTFNLQHREVETTGSSGLTGGEETGITA